MSEDTQGQGYSGSWTNKESVGTCIQGPLWKNIQQLSRGGSGPAATAPGHWQDLGRQSWALLGSLDPAPRGASGVLDRGADGRPLTSIGGSTTAMREDEAGQWAGVRGGGRWRGGGSSGGSWVGGRQARRRDS